MINVAVLGAAGRMGQSIIRCAEQVDGLRVCLAIEHGGHRDIGMPVPVGRDLVYTDRLQDLERRHDLIKQEGKKPRGRRIPRETLLDHRNFQTLQDKQQDAAEMLMGLKDPTVLLAVLPDTIEMLGLGPFGKNIADMLRAMQPPQMQQARDKDKKEGLPPQLQALVQQIEQQAAEAIKAMEAHAKELEQKVIELEDEKQANTVEGQSKAAIADKDNAVKLQIEAMQIEAKLQESRMDNETQIQIEREKIAAELELKKIDVEISRENARIAAENEKDKETAGV